MANLIDLERVRHQNRIDIARKEFYAKVYLEALTTNGFTLGNIDFADTIACRALANYDKRS